MSQQYTEVEWQDPAGGNPGTLINKARLDQMQTAHHYADGFEEVDTAPTADPGVDYHKVVYCTADSTFYRWDGTQWQKDIDDDTKALLLAHEADHANPHVVTKAQVGLGNADNTSDADKPISTATQTALDGKLDKQTAGSTQTKVYAVRGSAQRMLNAGYGTGEIPLYNYELGLSVKMPTVLDPTDDTVVNYGWANTELDKKADKADTYTKTETDTALATKADKATTLAGYGITDAYTKTEADTLLGAKADTTALTDGSVTKVGTADVGSDTKPIKLVAGVPTAVADALATQTYVSDALDSYLPMVRTANAQTIGGIKTFTNGIIAYPEGWHGSAGNNQAQGQWAIFAKITPTSVGAYHYIEFTENSNTAVAYGLLAIHESVTVPSPIWINRASRGGNNPLTEANTVTVLSDGTNLYLAWKKVPPYGGLSARSYFSNSYSTVRTPDQNITWYAPADRQILSNLDDYTVYDPIDSEVHTTGDQTVEGAKTFTGTMLATGQPAYSAGLAATTVATIGTLDAYTPMVRTSGNQDIAGNKTIKGIMITPMEGVWFSLSYGGTDNYSKICGIPSDTVRFNLEIEIMGYDGKMILHITKDNSPVRGFATWTDTANNTPIYPFVILNTTTGEHEVWGYRTTGRFYFYPKKLLFSNTSQSVDTMSKYGISTNTDPYGTPDYQTEGVNNPKINIPVRILTGTIENS